MRATPRRREVPECHPGILRAGSFRSVLLDLISNHPYSHTLTQQPQNFINPSTIRDITSLRSDFLSALSSLGFVPASSKPSDDALNTHSGNTNLVKAVIAGGLWPRIARVQLPKSAIKFDRVQAGTVQRANEAREYKFYDIRVSDAGGRVFVHPASVLFRAAEWKSPFVAYFQKQQTTKLFLRDATEVRAPLLGSGCQHAHWGSQRFRYMQCSCSEGRSM